MIKVAFDIGGTYIKSAVVTDELTIEHFERVRTPKNIDHAILNIVKARLETIIHQHEKPEVRLGISTAGAVDRDNKTIAYANENILNYTGTNFEACLKHMVSRIQVYNDVDAALLGELTQMNQNDKNVFCLTLGTGIGGSYYHKDFGLITGARHRPHQIGNLLYDTASKTYYEQRASTRALKRQLKASNYNHCDIPRLFDEAEDGYKEAQQQLSNWGREIARGIAEVQIMYDPDEIIIGGGVSAQQQRLLKYIVPHVPMFLPKDYGHANIRCAQFDNYAALIGAVSRM
ncbi:ROK family protein [Staphylococcus felis]|uniref:ROK family protein n=1 Tax=Staphylococcus felis TaxID=46127 RepID=UPI003966FDF1